MFTKVDAQSFKHTAQIIHNDKLLTSILKFHMSSDKHFGNDMSSDRLEGLDPLSFDRSSLSKWQWLAVKRVAMGAKSNRASNIQDATTITATSKYRESMWTTFFCTNLKLVFFVFCFWVNSLIYALTLRHLVTSCSP